MLPDRILLYCRAGFESECAQEIMDLAAECGGAGFVRAHKDSGYVEFVETMPGAALAIHRDVSFQRLIFARQWFLTNAMIDGLPERNRVEPLVARYQELGVRLGHLRIESPDTNEGKELATFCRKFTAPVTQTMKQAGLLSRKQDDAQAVGHVFFLDSRRAFVGYHLPGNGSEHQGGIMRLKFPGEAPSRSTLKLDEAILTFLSERDRERLLRASAKAVDLGAAPGGWTWQLVRRGLFVTSVDNGPMAPALMDTGQVTHKREDGFRFQPKQPVDWMVCDMVEQPRRVAELMADWLEQEWCRQTIFNLKLPMKRRYEELRNCLNRIEQRLQAAGLTFRLSARQLYHDREEVTVYVQLLS